MHQLQMAYLCDARKAQTARWWQESVIDSHMVIGREGLVDSFSAPYPGTFFVIVTNPMGASCASNPAVVPGTTTGVPVEPPATPKDRAIYCELIDVRGRKVVGRPARGLYIEVTVYASGRRDKRLVWK
jgi:hypothetical protein